MVHVEQDIGAQDMCCYWSKFLRNMLLNWLQGVGVQEGIMTGLLHQVHPESVGLGCNAGCACALAA
jgi:hypothetical protein